MSRRSRADAFSSLLGGLPDVAESGPGEVHDVTLDRIRVRSGQPRRYFDEAALAALSESVREQGVLQPVLLRPVDGDYEQRTAGDEEEAGTFGVEAECKVRGNGSQEAYCHQDCRISALGSS